MSNLIIGASSGLGREIAYEFARNSKNLILISTNVNCMKLSHFSLLSSSCRQKSQKQSVNRLMMTSSQVLQSEK